MADDRRDRVSDLYHAALQRTPAERSAYLTEACAGDEALRQEIESLLRYERASERFLEQPVAAVVGLASPASAVGRQIGPFKILALLGAGGMGEVYRAHDINLGRDVAIKFLPPQFIADADRRARFVREARLLATLNHPHIGAIYGLEEADGLTALVLELVEGPTLADRLERGPLPIPEALAIARQIAEALDAAHEKGIVHRDLKPANIVLQESLDTSGSVCAKLLDFGLAKAIAGVQGDSAERPVGPVARTEDGRILGTPGYMSPEQARGMRVDKRTDIWAFGCIVFEMLTRQRPFAGDTTPDTLARILEHEPDWAALPLATPDAVRRVVRRCLTKDPARRMRDIGDAVLDLETFRDDVVRNGRSLTSPEDPTARPTQDVIRQVAGPRGRAIALILLVLAGLAAMSYWPRTRPPAPVLIAQIASPEHARFGFHPSIALAPAGHALAFPLVNEAGTAQLWVRPLDSEAAYLLAGTEGGAYPFWSADSRTLGFFADNHLKTVAASGGPVIVVADAPNPAGGTWNADGTILFVPDYMRGVYRVPAAGGTPSTVVPMDKSKFSVFAGPRFLPDGQHFIYRATGGDPTVAGTYFGSLDGRAPRLLVRDNGGSAYASGYLLDVRGGALIAQRLDVSKGELTGDPVLVAPRVWTTGAAAMADASQNGLLVYAPMVNEKRLSWFDRAGKPLGVIGEPGDYYDVRLSPDGHRLAFNVRPVPPNGEIWVEDLSRSVHTRLTIDRDTDYGLPVWSPDGSSIVYAAVFGKAKPGIYRKPANGTGAEELILPSDNVTTRVWPTSWSHDGRFILYTYGSITVAPAEIRVLPLLGDRKPRVLVKPPAAAYDGQFSPDGRWMAYGSRESGRDEVYVVPFDAARVLSADSPTVDASAGGRWLVSNGGGWCPRWGNDGEIFYLSSSNQVMAAKVEEKAGALEVSRAQVLFRSAPSYGFDVNSDGTRFVVNSLSGERNTPLTLIVNWTATLQRK